MTMLNAKQFFYSVAHAVIITIALLYAMHLLIKTEQLELAEPEKYRHVSWVHIPKDSDPVTKKAIAAPPEIKTPPKIEKYKPIVDEKVLNLIPIGELPVKYDSPSNETGLYQSPQLVLMFASTPVYPPRRLEIGTQGYVQVGFNVDSVGRVFDAHIIDSEPKGAFEKSALKAIAKFKYKPRYEGGKAVATNGLSYLFRFEIE